jgi:AraC-like DNA-binding protein
MRGSMRMLNRSGRNKRRRILPDKAPGNTFGVRASPEGLASDGETELAVACCDPTLTACEFVDRVAKLTVRPFMRQGVSWSGRLRPAASPLSVLIVYRLNSASPEVLAWSLREWAESLSVSTAHLGRLLLAVAGCSFRDVRRLYRLKRAAQMLLVPGKRVSDVAFSVGYSHSQLGQFSREFRQLLGRAPSNFRSLVLTWPGSVVESLSSTS